MFDPRPGMRVVLRFRAGSGATDALGQVTVVDDASVTVETKRGPVRVPREDIILAHEVPPAPQRAGRLHEVVSAADVRRVAAHAWLPPEVTWLNRDNLHRDAAQVAGDEAAGPEAFVQSGWLLRAAGGVGKEAANSALPLDPPGVETAEALEMVSQWYGQHGLEPMVQIYSDADSNELAEPCREVAGLFRDAGFTPSEPQLALTAATAEAAAGLADPAAAAPAGLSIVRSDAPHGLHYDAWGHPEGSESHDAFAALMTSAEQMFILSAITGPLPGQADAAEQSAAQPAGQPTLIGTIRVALTHRWAVLSHLIVHPSARRRGVGAALVQAAAAAASQQGIRSLLADVPASNEAAVALMRARGGREHHRHWFALKAE